MTKIVLISNRGVYTDMLAEKLRDSAIATELEFKFYSVALIDLNSIRRIMPDIILYAPPRYWRLERVRRLCPNALVDMIEMEPYAFMDVDAIIRLVRRRLIFK